MRLEDAKQIEFVGDFEGFYLSPAIKQATNRLVDDGANLVIQLSTNWLALIADPSSSQLEPSF